MPAQTIVQTKTRSVVTVSLAIVSVLGIVAAGTGLFNQEQKKQALVPNTEAAAVSGQSKGNAFIFNKDKSLEVVTSRYLAGAISALEYDGKQYIYSIGHGSSLQYAASVDGLGGMYNPTEGGMDIDDYHLRLLDTAHPDDLALDKDYLLGPDWAKNPQKQLTTSVLKSFSNNGNVVQSKSRMAFWIGQKSVRAKWKNPETGQEIEFPAPVNQADLSDYFLTKKIEVGTEGMENVFKLDAKLDIPKMSEELKAGLGNPIYAGNVKSTNQTNPSLSVEMPTGYLLPEFSKYYEVVSPGKNPKNVDISQKHGTSGDDPYVTSNPIILTTQDEKDSMGVFSLPTQGSRGWPQYQTFITGSQFSPNCSKWNVSYNVAIGSDPVALNARTYLVLGEVKKVRDILSCLYQKYHDGKLDLDCSEIGEPTIIVTDPVNNTKLKLGQAYQIKWKTDGFDPETVDIVWTKEDGTWGVIKQNAPAKEGSFSWTVQGVLGTFNIAVYQNYSNKKITGWSTGLKVAN